MKDFSPGNTELRKYKDVSRDGKIQRCIRDEKVYRCSKQGKALNNS